MTASLSGPSTDKVTDRFGFREFTARDGQFFLNGEPFYMRAALDQDFYPDSIYSTPDKAYVVDAMTKGRKLGLNLLRCHIKVCDPDVPRGGGRSRDAGVVRGAELGPLDRQVGGARQGDLRRHGGARLESSRRS